MRKLTAIIIGSLVLFAFLLILNNIFKFFAYKGSDYQNGTGAFNVFFLNVHSSGSDFVQRSLRIDSLISLRKPDFVYLTEYSDSSSQMLDSLLCLRYRCCEKEVKLWNKTERIYSNWEIEGLNPVFIDKETNKVLELLKEDALLRTHIDHPRILSCHITDSTHSIYLYLCHLESNNYLNEITINDDYLPLSLKKIKRRVAAYSKGGKIRELEADAICGSIKSLTKNSFPIIVMGDFNDVSGSYCTKQIEDAGYHDAWWECGWGIGSTYKNKYLPLRIDHIFYNKKIQLRSVEIVDDDLSDHKAMLASFDF